MRDLFVRFEDTNCGIVIYVIYDDGIMEQLHMSRNYHDYELWNETNLISYKLTRFLSFKDLLELYTPHEESCHVSVANKPDYSGTVKYFFGHLSNSLSSQIFSQITDNKFKDISNIICLDIQSGLYSMKPYYIMRLINKETSWGYRDIINISFNSQTNLITLAFESKKVKQQHKKSF